MKIIITLLICLSLQIIVCFGQISDSVQNSKLFSKGIYLTDLKILIPWIMDYKKLNYYNPIIQKMPNGRIRIKWDSVHILNEISLNLSYVIPKDVLNSSKRFLVRMEGEIDSSNMIKSKVIFEKYSKVKGQISGSKKIIHTSWDLDDCQIRVFIREYIKQNKYYIFIEKHPRRKNCH